MSVPGAHDNGAGTRLLKIIILAACRSTERLRVCVCVCVYGECKCIELDMKWIAMPVCIVYIYVW